MKIKKCFAIHVLVFLDEQGEDESTVLIRAMVWMYFKLNNLYTAKKCDGNLMKEIHKSTCDNKRTTTAFNFF